MPNIDADSLNNPAINFENRSTDPAAPGSGRAKLYIKDGEVYVRLDTGDPTSVSGSVALAEGLLAVGSAAGILSALSAGTEGQVVTADASGHATWAAASGGLAFSGASLTKSSTQSITQQAETAITFDGEAFDTDAYHDNSTNNTRLTIPVTGRYLVTWSTRVDGLADAKGVQVYIRVNNSAPTVAPQAIQITNGPTCSVAASVSALLSLTEADYVESFIWHGDTTSRLVNTSANGTTFAIMRVS